MWDKFKALLLVLGPQLPLVGLLFANKDQAQQNPILAALLAFLYEVLAYLLLFGRKVWQKLKEQYEEKLVQSTADWLVANLTRQGAKRDYYRQVRTDFRDVDLKGLPKSEINFLYLSRLDRL